MWQIWLGIKEEKDQEDKKDKKVYMTADDILWKTKDKKKKLWKTKF